MPKKLASAKIKKVQKKNVAKPEKTAKIQPKAKSAESKKSTLTVSVVDIHGKNIGSQLLPKEIFGQKPNQVLLAQAVRVYFTNQTAHYGSTKTRSQVRGGGAKPYRQKHTGRARAGSIRSPLWVGGAITHGPQFRKTKLDLPKKMRRKALVAALSAKAQTGEIKIVKNLEKIQPKTKVVALFFEKLNAKGNNLLVVSKDKSSYNVFLASRNIPQVAVDYPNNLNAYEVISNDLVFFSKEALFQLALRMEKAKS